MFDFLKRKVAKATRSIPIWMKARFDAASTSKDNAKHWAAAEFLSADAEADSAARKILRTRSRYEVQNNSYARGIVNTIADDTIGTGPRLQMLMDSDELNKEIEHDFLVWAKRVHLAQKLRTMRVARCQDGESFAIMAQNPALPTKIKLDLQLIEADRVTDEDMRVDDEHKIDGIEYDTFGNPKLYKVMKKHPGGTESFNLDFVTIKAENMIHVFRQDRPEQHRGVPEIMAALPLFAQLRRYTLAVVSAAEAAADFAGVLYTDAPANGEADSIEAMDTIQLERNMLMTMPGGWKMAQVDPKQPTTTYGEFKHEVLNEIARCLSIPYNIAACNSSGYNYASGRLDHQTYYKSLSVDRAFIEEFILDRILEKWIREWMLVKKKGVDECDCRHVWFWDGHEHVDPSKEATAQEKRLANNTPSLASEYAKQGKDWETELRQIAKERKLMEELGITSEELSNNDGKENDGNEDE